MDLMAAQFLGSHFLCLHRLAVKDAHPVISGAAEPQSHFFQLKAERAVDEISFDGGVHISNKLLNPCHE